ncbi:hypothetical protein [Enterobacter hormaechei]|uniref:hypothetical protein n=1 Tax=Enterobacter hormaechei TaxID=158836 RepID=UPI0018C2CA6E|nr:hypothetical protein [Enterobacter hormaechei]MBF9834248.1 hypothetical protein [Enterobacter hormaechei]
MDQECKTLHGTIRLSYSEGQDDKPLTVVMPESDRETFMMVAQQVYSVTERNAKKKMGASDDSRVDSSGEILYIDVPSDEDTQDESYIVPQGEKEAPQKEAITMSGMSREELQAHLDKNKAEVSAIASDLRSEMEKWSKDNSEKISQLTISINALNANIEGKAEATNGRLEGVQSQMNGMNTAIAGVSTAISGIQSGLSTKLTIFGVIITVVIALVGFGANLMSGNTSKAQPDAPQPIVIQVPQSISPPAPAPAPAPQTNTQPHSN